MGTILGVPIIRIIVLWGLYWGPLILGNYQISKSLRIEIVYWIRVVVVVVVVVVMTVLRPIVVVGACPQPESLNTEFPILYHLQVPKP